MDRYERLLAAQGFTRVAGADEAGRGALAGPLVAAAVILPDGFDIEGINDSKMLTEPQREAAVRAHRGGGRLDRVQGRAGSDRRAGAAPVQHRAAAPGGEGARARLRADRRVPRAAHPVPLDRGEEGRRGERERGGGLDRGQGHEGPHHAPAAPALSRSSGSTTTRATARPNTWRCSIGTARRRCTACRSPRARSRRCSHAAWRPPWPRDGVQAPA